MKILRDDCGHHESFVLLHSLRVRPHMPLVSDFSLEEDIDSKSPIWVSRQDSAFLA